MLARRTVTAPAPPGFKTKDGDAKGLAGSLIMAYAYPVSARAVAAASASSSGTAVFGVPIDVFMASINSILTPQKATRLVDKRKRNRNLAKLKPEFTNILNAVCLVNKGWFGDQLGLGRHRGDRPLISEPRQPGGPSRRHRNQYAFMRIATSARSSALVVNVE